MSPTSPQPQSPDDQSLPAWHFPFGPSSKYNRREKSRPQHTRHLSAYTPVAPNLSTAHRAHRRAYTQQKATIPSQPSPPSSEYSRSPLSRFASYSTPSDHTSPATISMPAPNGSVPITPAKSQRRSSSFQNSSPFSDYYTDEARSEDSSLPDSETKQLLVRMHKLQAQLMRDQASERQENSNAIRIIGSKLSEIELELNSLQSQTRSTVELDEVISEGQEDGAGAGREQETLREPYLSDHATDLPSEPVTVEQFRAERDWFILRMQDLLSGLNAARSELGRRFAEVKEQNERHNAELDERETQLEQLQSANEMLRSQAGFEYSELLFLKLQMKSLEVDVDSMSDVLDCSETAVSRAVQTKKNRILSEMDRWRSDWQDVHGRFQRRRSQYGGISPDRGDSTSQDESHRSADEVEWHLETVKEGRGRVTSLTIRRMDSSAGSTPIEGSSNDDRLADSTLGESLYGMAKKSLPLSASIDSSGSTAEIFKTTVSPNSLTIDSPSRDRHTFSQQTDLEGHSLLHTITPGHGEPQVAPLYKNHGTQTEQETKTSHPSNAQDEEEEDEGDEEDENSLFPDEEISLIRVQTERGDDDCAITTSSEASDDERDTIATEGVKAEFEDPTASMPSKSAWQELWSSLANLSGMGDERFD